MHRILLIGLGPVGRMVAADAARRRLCEVVAAVDVDPALVGTPVAKAAPESGFAATIVPSLANITNWSEIDAAVVCTSSDLAKCAPTFRELIPRGLPIVSTCEELVFPWLRHKALAEDLHALALRYNSRLLGTGVNPGFLMDTLPVAASAVCRSVRSVRVWRIQDATPRRIPFQQKIGAGLNDQQFAARVKDGSLRHVGLGESLHFIAHTVGLDIDAWDESIEPVKSDTDLACALGPIPRGHAAGVRQVARGWARGGSITDPPLIQLEFQAAIAQPDPHDRIVLDSEPPIDMVIRNGVHGDVATVAIALNSIASLMAAPPGLHTMATVPLVRCGMSGRA